MARVNFGYILRKLRHSRDETLEQVSDATGLSVAMLSRIERGERLPSPESVEALARHFDLPVDYLMSETIANRMVNRYGEESTSRAAEHLSREPVDLGLFAPDYDEVGGSGEIGEAGAAGGVGAVEDLRVSPRSRSQARPRTYGLFEEMDIRAALQARGPRRPVPPVEEGSEIDPATERVLRAAREASEAASVLVLREAPALSSRARLELIGRIADLAGQAIDALHILAADPDDRVRRAARDALRRLVRG